ncbi:MAG: methylmalonyl Co-A mutase-associated GTPase MeaB [Elusimicrobia bacterium]|nr:methylmalonyl Co-A mutase-associated GTPase MeaB [Elusimicrobiota bacterium]
MATSLKKSKETFRELARAVVRGDRRAASRALTFIVEESAGFEDLLRAFFPYGGRAHIVGLTGPPGSGKSTLLSRLICGYRLRGLKVGALAVDPSSVFSGGALLGDRIRMQQHALDSEVFIRSLAARDAVGGLPSNIFGAIHVLEAFGCGIIFLETVGAGQDEVAVAKAADTVVLVTVPSLGDEIQAIKAGTMEIGDLFVVNKADLAQKDRAIRDLQSALSLGQVERGWKPPVLATVAVEDTGTEAAIEQIEKHRRYLKSSGEWKHRRRAQVLEELTLAMARRIYRRSRNRIREKHLEALVDKRTDPVALSKKLLKK